MEIQYLKLLKDNPSRDGRINMPLSETEILQLEQIYNNSNSFPRVLKELLFLAGEYCIVMDYGISNNQHDFQEFVREDLLEFGKIFTRPFFAVETYSNDYVIFLYLDEGDNPRLYRVFYNDAAADFEQPIKQLNHTLLSLINNRVQRVKEGEILFSSIW